MAVPPFVQGVLGRLKLLRERKGLSAGDVERALILGPGWVDAFEGGSIVPTFDVLLAVLGVLGVDFHELTSGLEATKPASELVRRLYAVQDGRDVILHFAYGDFDARYRLCGATTAEFDGVVREMRDGLAREVAASTDDEGQIKTDSVARTFLRAIATWPNANPSDLWWFLVYRAYCDPFNHPAKESRRDFGQSWKRTGGWALEEVLVRHYGPWLASQNVRLVLNAQEKSRLLPQLVVEDRLELDKADVLLSTSLEGVERCFGVVHVKASFAERRTDDVPMSQILVGAGYTSPLWTMDCKSGPSADPENRGELGTALEEAGRDNRSAKRKDIEEDGYFSGCFSYNQSTVPTPSGQSARARIVVCDFRNPDDAFGQFLKAEGQRFRSNPPGQRRGAV